MSRKHENSADLHELLDAVRTLPCSYSRKAMLRTLRSLVGRRLFLTRRDLVAPDELALCLSLLGAMPIVEVRDALMVRLQIGRAKAYRLITAGLQTSAGHVPATKASPSGMRQLALALEDDGID